MKAAFPTEWCFYTKTDTTYQWWPFYDVTIDALTILRARHAASIPFSFLGYWPSGDGSPLIGSLLVGFEVLGDAGDTAVRITDNQPPRALSNRAAAPSCSLGDFILAAAPFAVVQVAPDLAGATVIDPAPEYRWWYLSGRPRRVRSILHIPVTYKVGANNTPGYIIVALADAP
ncbi:MAG TPA: hypothetical protein VMS64_27500 [Candidatus Methylomirabilis sp.]|nr:hypothetical protein [Candidatus Methylomirabilis sp.]